MSAAIDSSVETFKAICTLAEARIDEHLARYDATKDKANAPILTISALSDELSGKTKISQPECMYVVYLYLRARPELEVRTGKTGGIWRIEDTRPAKSLMTPQECAHRHYQVVKECAAKMFEEGFAKGEESNRAQHLIREVKLNFQDLAQDVANKLGYKKYVAYHCMKEYVEKERLDLVIDKGRHGGLRKR